jgi:hypothetical protein
MSVERLRIGYQYFVVAVILLRLGADLGLKPVRLSSSSLLLFRNWNRLVV